MVMRTMRKNVDVLKWVFGVLAVVLIIGLVLPGTFSSRRDLANAAAVVDGEPVPQRRYSQSLNQELETARRAAGGELSDAESLKVRKRVLSDLVDETLAVNHAADLGQSMSEAEFRDAVVNDPSLKDEKGAFDQNRYLQILQRQADQGMAVDEVEAGFQRGMLLQKIRGFWQTQAVLDPAESAAAEAKLNRQVQAQAAVWDLKKLQAGIKLDDEAVRSYYSRNKQRWAKPAEYKLRQILLRADFGASTATAKAKAEALLAKLKAGADFKALAAKENADEAARKNSGDLGWIKRNELRHPELAAELNFVKVGGLSQVVQTPEGFHILKLEAKKDGFEPTLANSRAKAADDLGKEEAARLAEKLANKALSEVKAGKSLAEAAKANQGQLSTTGWFDRDSETALAALGKDASFANLVLALDKGEVTPQPVAGPKAVAIAVITAERAGKAPAKPEAAASRRRIALAQAQNKKAQALYDAWIEGLKKKAKIKDQSGVLASK